MESQYIASDLKSGGLSSNAGLLDQRLVPYKSSLWTFLKQLAYPTSDLGPAEIILRLTALLLLMRPMGPWGLRPFILGLAGLSLALPRWLRAPATWYALAALVMARIAADWPLPDNHVYLLAYWCLALALALGAREGALVISRSSRLLLGLAFLMAVVWKGLLSTDYLDGRCWSFTLVMDPRFEGATLLLGGLTSQQLAESREYLRPLPPGAELVDPPALVEPYALSMVLTWGSLALEALLAFVCLFSLPERMSVLRHCLLLLFCVITYALAPVAGFGWLLLTMGIALCRPDERRLRATYIGVWCLVLLYDAVSWWELLVKWLG